MDAQNRLYTEIPFNGGSEKKVQPMQFAMVVASV